MKREGEGGFATTYRELNVDGAIYFPGLQNVRKLFRHIAQYNSGSPEETRHPLKNNTNILYLASYCIYLYQQIQEILTINKS